MITNFILVLIVQALSLMFGWLPIVTIDTIPKIGALVSSSLFTMITTWNALVITIPYFQFTQDVFIWVILPFESLMLLGKFILGNRMPDYQK